MDYLTPRRFARLWEMSRTGPPECGTIPEQQAVRDVFTEYAPFDSLLDRVLFAVDKQINREGRRYLAVTIHHEPGQPSFWGMTGGASIVLYPPDGPLPKPSSWAFVVLHEFGHVVGRRLFNPADMTEAWAVLFQQWAMGGQSEYHPAWARLAEHCPPVV